MIAGLRRRSAEQEAVLRYQLDQHEAETRRLARELLPKAIQLLQRGRPPRSSCATPCPPMTWSRGTRPRTGRC
ncbi:hypothetical protein ACFQ2B_28905 [Streptomyces stramineus]